MHLYRRPAYIHINYLFMRAQINMETKIKYVNRIDRAYIPNVQRLTALRTHLATSTSISLIRLAD